MNSSIGSLTATFGLPFSRNSLQDAAIRSNRDDWYDWLTGCNECSASSRAGPIRSAACLHSIRQIQVSPRGIGRQPRPIFRTTDRLVGGWRAGLPKLAARGRTSEISDQPIRCCHVVVHGFDPVHWRLRNDVVHRLVDQSLDFSTRAIAPIIENPAGRADNAEGLERDFEPPSSEEVEELLEPTLEETINAVTDAVSQVAATVATTQATSNSKGDSRPPGPEGEGEDIVPRFERWQLNFSAHNIQEYAAQLDFYQIELGAIGGNVQGVDVANNLAGTPKSRRVVDTEQEQRLYFIWTSPSPLMQYDRQLLRKANISLQGKRQMLKFIPPDLENLLAQTELQYAKEKGHQSVTEIAKTIFESASDRDGYKFTVVSQRYRTPRK